MSEDRLQTQAESVARFLGDAYRLRPPHPYAGREAMQCVACNGIFYPNPLDPVLVCPYCKGEDD